MAKTKTLTIRVTPGQFACIDAAAAAAGMGRAPWLRGLGLRAAKYANHPAPLPARPPRRPPARLTHAVRTNFTEEQFEELDEHARASELGVGAFVREVVLGSWPVARRPLARSAIVAVNRGVKELHQLVELANCGTLLTPDLMQVLTELLGQIHALRDTLLTADAAASSTPEPTP
jgi:hypothetical protein